MLLDYRILIIILENPNGNGSDANNSVTRRSYVLVGERDAGNLLAPIFNSSQLKAQARAQRARAEQALISYQAILQNAFREVEDALVAVRTLRDEHTARVRQRNAARNAARLSRARYDGGVVNYLEVLDSERSLFTAELEESATRQQYLNAVIRLYKALGGGWNPETQEMVALTNKEADE